MCAFIMRNESSGQWGTVSLPQGRSCIEFFLPENRRQEFSYSINDPDPPPTSPQTPLLLKFFELKLYFLTILFNAIDLIVDLFRSCTPNGQGTQLDLYHNQLVLERERFCAEGWWRISCLGRCSTSDEISMATWQLHSLFVCGRLAEGGCFTGKNTNERKGVEDEWVQKEGIKGQLEKGETRVENTKSMAMQLFLDGYGLLFSLCRDGDSACLG